MTCTPEEIERKRQIALRKLAEKGQLVKGKNPQGVPQAKRVQHFTVKALSTSPMPSNSTKQMTCSPKNSNFNINFGSAKNSNDCPIKNKVDIVLISPTRFQVITSKYSQTIIDIIKALKTRAYDPKTRIWDIHLKEYKDFLSKLKLVDQITLEVPKWINTMSNTIETNEKEDFCYDFTIIDEELRATLMPFQEESICFAIKRNGRCFIADEMGLGKTIQALAIASYYKHDWPLCVVTTASTTKSWETTILKYITSVPILKVFNYYCADCIPSDARIIVVSYDLMTRRIKNLKDFKCGVVIFDESHTLKNYKTKCYGAASCLSKIAKRVILLSGTPALSKPSELYTQLSLIDDTFFGGFIDYSRRYCDGKESPYGWDANGKSNLQELQIVLETRFMIRRTKLGMSSLNLPEKSQQAIVLDMKLEGLSKEERESLEKLQGTDFSTVIKNDREILPFFHATAQIKIPAVCSYINQMVQKEERKFIIFAHHLIMMDALEEILAKNRKTYIRIDGRTNNRESLVQKFQNDSKCVCALLSITAANSGITLTSGNLVIFTELHWTPSILAQAEARAHRIGQRSAVTVQYLIAPKTVDDYIWPMLQRKQRTLKDMSLTNESYDKVTKVAINNTAPSSSPSKRSTIESYFSPAKRPNSNDDDDDTKENNDAKKACIEKSSSTDSRLDDEWDDVFESVSTQKIMENCVDASFSEEFFNDDWDDVLGAVDIDF